MSAELSHSDWLVLGALGTGATHGFAVSASLAKEGDLGRIWSVRRPMVYQSVGKLVSLGLVAELASERSSTGPSRTPLELTAEGRQLLQQWLTTPVDHLRDMRPLLLAKLVLLDRLGLERGSLIAAQRARFAALIEVAIPDDQDDVDRLVGQWRIEVARAAIAFLDGCDRAVSRPR